MWGIRRSILFLVGALLSTAGALALDPVNQTRSGVAIEGYDPVAYFTDGMPVKGRPEIAHSWRGATWQFASEEHRELFVSAPEKYAPQYGGYCAWAVSRNSTAGIDPTAWTVVDGKLYLNYSAKIQAKWAKDLAGNIARADSNWPRLLRRP